MSPLTAPRTVRHGRSAAALVVAALAATLPVRADSAPRAAAPNRPPAPALEEILREALASNPELHVHREQLVAARDMVAVAGALPDPMLELMYTEAGFPGFTVGDEDMSMLGVEWRQNLLRPAKREAKRATARAEQDWHEIDIEMMNRRVVREARVLYGRLYAIDQELANLGAAREMGELIKATTTSRYSVGEVEQEAVLKAQLTLARLTERETDLRAERRRALAAFMRLLNRTRVPDWGPVAALPPLDWPQEDWTELALNRSSEVRARRMAVEVAKRKVQEARSELKANHTLAGSASYRGSMDPVVTLRFGFELPFWRREKQLPMVRIAERALEEAEHLLLAEEARVREMVEQIAAMRSLAEEQIVLYRDGILPLARQALSAARNAYLGGEGNFSVMLEDFNMWLEARTMQERREAELFTAWTELQMLVEPRLPVDGEVAR